MRLNLIGTNDRPPLNKMFNELKKSIQNFDWYTPNGLLKWKWSKEEIEELHQATDAFIQKYARGTNLQLELDEFTTGFYELDNDVIDIKLSSFDSIDDNFIDMVVHETYHAINHRRSGGKIKKNIPIGSNEDKEETAARGWSAYKQLSFQLDDNEIAAGLRNPTSLKGKSELFDQYLDKPELRSFLKSVYKAMTGD